MTDPREISALLRAWVLVALGVVVVIAILRPLTPHGWPPQRRRAAVWTGAHVAAAFAAFALMPGIILPLINPESLAVWLYGFDVPKAIANTLAFALSNTLAMPLLLVVWRGLLSLAESDALPAISLQRTLRETRLGLQTWFWLTPIVFLTNLATLAIYMRLIGKPAEHPLLQPFESGVPPVGVVLLLMTSAVLAAPICEEVLFRGILLPWLASRSWGGPAGLLIAAVTGVMKRSTPNFDFRDGSQWLTAASPVLLVLALIPVERTLPYWPGVRRLLPIAHETSRVHAVRAIVSSAAIFANCHASVWPSPIPLTVLAIGLGWLALRTQSVVAPIIVHMLFNAVAFAFELSFK